MISPAAWLRASLVALLAAVPAAAAAPAAAQTDCTAAFNGIEADRISSISSPLLLNAEDELVLTGTDPAGTTRASVSVVIGPLTLARASGTSAEPITDFTISLPLEGVARDSVGLLRLQGVTDHCGVDAWLRLGGRSMLATTAGLIGGGLGLLGLAGQGLALALRRSWSPWLAGEAGLITGAGAALLGQQWGRLQLSGWSLIACMAIAVAAGVALALLLRRRRPAPAEVPAETPFEAESPVAVAPASPTAAPALAAAAAPIAMEPTPAAPAVTSPETPAPPAPAPSPAPLPYWGYVLADTPVLDLADYSRTVATLQPGTWYLVEREVGPWAQVEAAAGLEGWAPRRALHREA